MSPKTVFPREEEQLDGVLFAMLVLRGFWCAWLLKCLEEMRFCAERKILSENISPKQSRGGTIRNV